MATVSFSLTIATACSARSRSSVRWALVCCTRIEMSCAVSSTCPTVRPYRANAALHEFTSATCPTLAAACLVARSLGRRRQSERLDAGGDGARGDDDDVGAGLHPRLDRVGEPGQPAGVEHAGRRGQRGGADLDHDAARGPDGVAVLSRSPLLLIARPRIGCPARARHASSPRSRRCRRAALRSAAPTRSVRSSRTSVPRPDSVTSTSRRRLRLPVERHVPDGHRAPGLGAQPQQFVLDTEPGQPVAEVADGLVVVEVGLARPNARAVRRAPRSRRLAVRLDGEAAVVDGHRTDHRPPRHRLAAARRCRPTPSPTARRSTAASLPGVTVDTRTPASRARRSRRGRIRRARAPRARRSC